MAEYDDDKFENEEDRKEFERLYENFKRAKDSMSYVSEYYKWLKQELNTHGYAVVPEKYTGLKNCPICIMRAPEYLHVMFIAILN